MHELLLKNIIKRCRDYADEPSDAKRMPNIGDETAVVAIADLARQLETANGIIGQYVGADGALHPVATLSK